MLAFRPCSLARDATTLGLLPSAPMSRVVLTALVVLAGCDAFASGEPVAFTTLTAPMERVAVNGTTVLRDPQALAAFVRETPNEGPVSFPDVDFERQIVLGVFYGGSFHAGCTGAVEVIESVQQERDELVVRIGPLPDLGPCRAVVYPSQLVVVDATSPKVRFEGPLPR